jgi:hypothetical protein
MEFDLNKQKNIFEFDPISTYGSCFSMTNEFMNEIRTTIEG